MPNGTVKFFNAGKGFGFITPDGGAKDVFVPSASMAASGIATLKPGQRVSFEEAPDAKGPKAVNLKLLEAPSAPAAAPRPPKQADNGRVTLYCDPSLEESEDILFALRDAGLEPVLVDYIATPPTRDQLKALAALLRSSDQSLVRRYDHMFAELRLDDRFISENDYWDAVVEHPTLINGPVVALGGRAAICRSADALKEFLAPQQGANGAKPKSLSPALLRLMMGHAPVPKQQEARVEAKPVAEPKPAPMAAAMIEVAVRPKAKETEKLASKPKAAAKPAAKAKSAPKVKEPVKKAAPKAKKSRR